MSARTYYKDSVTERRTFTTGKFERWERGGVFGFWYAVFIRRRSALFVPRWSIEDAEALPPLPIVGDS